MDDQSKVAAVACWHLCIFYMTGLIYKKHRREIQMIQIYLLQHILFLYLCDRLRCYVFSLRHWGGLIQVIKLGVNHILDILTPIICLKKFGQAANDISHLGGRQPFNEVLHT